MRMTGANLKQTRSSRHVRPNEESRLNEPNRAVALQLARQFGRDAGTAVLENRNKPQ